MPLIRTKKKKGGGNGDCSVIDKKRLFAVSEEGRRGDRRVAEVEGEGGGRKRSLSASKMDTRPPIGKDRGRILRLSPKGERKKGGPASRNGAEHRFLPATGSEGKKGSVGGAADTGLEEEGREKKQEEASGVKEGLAGQQG